MTEYQESSQQL